MAKGWNFNKHNVTELSNIDDTYTLVCKDSNTIIDEITKVPEAKVKIKLIIDNLEQQIADILRNDGIAYIPHFGNISKHPSGIVLKENFKTLKEASKRMNKEEYMEFSKSIFAKAKRDKEKELEAERKAKLFKKVHFKPYMKILSKYGETYANIWIQYHNKYNIVEYNPDVEQQWREYYGTDKHS